MPVLEEALYAYLPQVQSVSDLVDDRIFPVRVPEGAGLPAIVWQRISAQRAYDHDPFEDTKAWVRARIQFTCWATTAVKAIEIGEALVAALSGYSGDMDGVRIGSITVEFELDGYEAETKLYRRIVDVFVSYEEGGGAS